MGHNSVAYIHHIAEALKLAFADRHRYYGDPKFVDVPLDALLSRDYAAARRKLIRNGEAWKEMPPAGDVTGYAPATALPKAAAGRARTGCRYVVRVRDRQGRQRVLHDAERRIERDAGHTRHRALPVLARLADRGPIPRIPPRSRPGKRPRLHAQPGDAAARRQGLHALRLARQRHPAAGDGAGAAERRGLGHGSAGGGRSAPLRDLQLPVLAPSRTPIIRAASTWKAGSTAPSRRGSPRWDTTSSRGPRSSGGRARCAPYA